MGVRIAKQSCLGCPFHEVGGGLQIFAGIGHAVAVHGVGEIERQIAAKKFIVAVQDLTPHQMPLIFPNVELYADVDTVVRHEAFPMTHGHILGEER